MGQGYDQGHVNIYQDDLSCVALVKHSEPGSERSYHITIRHFRVAERVAAGNVIVENSGRCGYDVCERSYHSRSSSVVCP